MIIKNKVKECLQQKTFTQYSGRIGNTQVDPEDMDGYYNDSMTIEYVFRFPSTSKEVHEEVLIFDEIGLLGSLGGSLGLFVGFSIFGYATPILEAIYEKVADMLQSTEILKI